MYGVYTTNRIYSSGWIFSIGWNSNGWVVVFGQIVLTLMSWILKNGLNLIQFFFRSSRWRISIGAHANMGIQQFNANPKHSLAIYSVQNSIEFISLIFILLTVLHRIWYLYAVYGVHIAAVDNVLDIICEWLEFVSNLYVIWTSLWYSFIGIG